MQMLMETNDFVGSVVIMLSFIYFRGLVNQCCTTEPATETTAMSGYHVPSKMVFSKILTGPDDGIVVLCMNGPHKKNALSKEFTSQFENAIQQLLKSKRQIRVLIVRSLVPGIFCAGADLKERIDMNPDEVWEICSQYRTMFTALHDMPFPTIAALDGHALGGGLEMALACDLRIAADPIRIGLVETSLAVMPAAGGTRILPQIVGVAKAKELIFTAKVLNARQAHETGLVNEFLLQNDDSSAAYHECLKMARAIARNGPVAVRAAKKAIDQSVRESDQKKQTLVEIMCYEETMNTKDRIEGLQAFQQKRSPKFGGD
jgi:methylglutaconyl-CoA hydratase